MDLQLRYVKTYWHVRILYPELPFSQGPRKEEEHQVLVRILQREKAIEKVYLHRVLLVIFERINEICSQLIDL